MREVAPGVFHWRAYHERIGIDAHSYLLEPARVLLDPMLPHAGLDAVTGHGRPHTILLTNRHHYRDSERFVEELGCVVRAPRTGMHEFAPGAPVEPYDPGDELPGGVVAYEVGAICPDENALHHPGLRVLACADGVFRGDDGSGPLGFVPDELMGDDPAAVKEALRASYRLLAAELDFDHLLLAHGEPIAGSGREALRAFATEHV